VNEGRQEMKRKSFFSTFAFSPRFCVVYVHLLGKCGLLKNTLGVILRS